VISKLVGSPMHEFAISTTIKVYVPEIVVQLKDFYADYLEDLGSYPSIYIHLKVLAQRLNEGVQEKEKSVLTEISNYHKDYLGKKELIDPKEFTLEDCQQTIANEYGFPDWLTLAQQTQKPYNLNFEHAVSLLLSGNLTSLTELITDKPQLLQTRSQYGHQATLLNYAGSNGVEFWRQQVPSNLPEITRFLINAGADKSATMKVYGGHYNTYELVVTSAHPEAAGLMEEMKEALQG